MGKKKVKRPAPIGGAAVKSRRVARSITSRYHLLQNERAQVQRAEHLSEEEKRARINELQQQMDALGGTSKYQQASIVNTSLFKTSKWVLKVLQELEMKPSTAGVKLDTLEVGAVNVQLQECKWLNVRAIDLNAQHPSIEECDFFSIEPQQHFDVVVCSMVSTIFP